MEHLLADTGVWYAMFDARDPYHNEAGAKAEIFKIFGIVMPWPIVYETLCTRFVRNKVALTGFERFLKSPNFVYLDDSTLRDSALKLSIESSLRGGRPLSMTDCLIRLLLEDVKTRIGYLATFNRKDFQDICLKRQIEMI